MGLQRNAFAVSSILAMTIGCSSGLDPESSGIVEPPLEGVESCSTRELTDQEREALEVALEQAGVLEALGPAGELVLGEVRDVGGLSVLGDQTTRCNFEGVFVQSNPRGCDEPSSRTALVAWQGFDPSAQRVQSAVVVVADGLVDQGVLTVDGVEATAWINDAQTGTTAGFGSLALGSNELQLGGDCMGEATAFDCTVALGTAEGTLAISGNSAVAGIVQRDAEFALPASRVTLDSCPWPSTGDCGTQVSTSQGTLTIGCTSGDCTCELDGVLLGTCQDADCAPESHCCLSFLGDGSNPPTCVDSGLNAAGLPYRIDCVSGACECTEDGVVVGTCMDSDCDPVGHCCDAFFSAPNPGGPCANVTFIGADQNVINCNNGACSCDQNGVQVGTCSDVDCDPVGHCCDAFF